MPEHGTDRSIARVQQPAATAPLNGVGDTAALCPPVAGSPEPLLEVSPFGQIAPRNTLWNGLQFAINLVAGVVTSAVVARALEPTGMGAYSYLMWVASVLIVAGSLGLPEALLTYVSEFAGRGDRNANLARLLAALAAGLPLPIYP